MRNFLLVATAAFMLNSCADLGKKGAWGADVKKAYLDGCTKGQSIPGVDQKKFCDCTLSKMEAQFDPTELEKVKDDNVEVLKFTTECMMTSVTGEQKEEKKEETKEDSKEEKKDEEKK